VSGYPVQPSKVQRPGLRDDTLARERLLQWLEAKIHHRVVYVIAEAGYGKTTLLADFSRRSRLRMLWYRLDAEDGNWIAFLSHLVAAGREHDPGFATSTGDLLRDFGTTGPVLETVLETFIRDVQSLGESGAVFVLDDYHVVDEAPDITVIMRQLLARAPERVTFLIASRRLPSLPIARLRGQGEVAELRTDDLRFSEEETEQLFRETYGRPLERDVIDDLSRRTEGWAASLQLVHSAIRGRSSTEVRSFVRTISGAEGELYDYLAEEVIGGLPLELQRFVMRASLLEEIDLEYVSVVADVKRSEAVRHLDAAAAAGLLHNRRRRAAGGKFHPLVREFLKHRLETELGSNAVSLLHREVAASAVSKDWRIASRHFAEAGDRRSIVQVIAAQLRNIASQGAYEEAAQFIGPRSEHDQPAIEILLARVDLQRGRLESATTRAEKAVAATSDRSPEHALALATLLAALVDWGDARSVRATADALLHASDDPTLTAIANATLRFIDVSSDGNVATTRAELERMAEEQRAAGQVHYLGVTMLNISDCLRVEGRFEDASAAATEAIEALERSSSGIELAMARSVRAWATAHLRGIEAAAGDIGAVLDVDSPAWSVQLAHEIADVIGFYGDPVEAQSIVTDLECSGLPPSICDPLKGAQARALLRDGRWQDATDLLDDMPGTAIASMPAFRASIASTRAWAAVIGGAAGSEWPEAAIRISKRQAAGLWLTVARVIVAAAGPRGDWPPAIRSILRRDPAYLSMTAELVVERLDLLPNEDLDLLLGEVRSRPLRWRRPLRRAVEGTSQSVALRSAALLEEVGDSDDIARLRGVARRFRKAPGAAALGRSLARRMAGTLEVEDLGRVRIKVGNRDVPTTGIRRKVLAMLCFLLAQRGFSATRDQALEALWPDQDPSQALNSLNQTLYFLRRVIEPNYDDDLSPGYVHHDAELIWLDQDLVTSRAAKCRELIRSLPAEPLPEQIESLASLYVGRFALDFEYDDWAQEYRDWLHSSVLETLERAVRSDTQAGQYSRGIRIAQRALEVQPDADEVELSLVRLYRLSGAHTAAAERYAHYAAVIRTNFGVEPPALESL
jgi:ATP/maltotriose-dependent transcriptional regulator MalT/DNA-binding SARP family transcriptional activator